MLKLLKFYQNTFDSWNAKIGQPGFPTKKEGKEKVLASFIPVPLFHYCYLSNVMKLEKKKFSANTNSLIKCINKSIIIPYAEGTKTAIRVKWEPNTL